MANDVRAAMVLFPELTQLDLTGPYEVLSRTPGVSVSLVAESLAPVRSEFGLAIVPDATFDTAPACDLLFVPGGRGIANALASDALLSYVRAQGQRARYVTSVCTGALVLGAVGLLRGYRATTHWLSLDLLAMLGAEAVSERVVIDRNRITGGGVTAGIDFGLVLASHLAGERVAHEIQLLMEYDPAPPFRAGSPASAPPDVVAHVREARKRTQDERRALLERVLERYG